MSRLLSLIATTCLTLLIAGCNTLSVDIIVPDAVSQNEPFVFEAVADPDAVGQIAYEWYLDDIIISSQPIDNAIIATAGLHTLRVKITDEEGETGEADVDLSVIAAEVLNADFAVNVFAYNMDEEPLADVTVTIDGSTSLTNAEGESAFTGLTQTPVLVVSAQKDGYIPQSYRFDLNGTQQSADVELTLMERAAPVTFNNDSEITVNGDSLNALVTLPASAFVDSDGNPVTGEITALITPIDTREMGASYLGGGVALTDESEVVQLLSLGMIDFEFTQNNQPLQLAADVSATIEMDLTTTTGPDGRVYTIGEEIEMWWFDDVNGLWVEEGVGEIVASATSPTGMRLVATVEHFTTWNWDYYKAEDRASITLNCIINGSVIGANDNCNVSLSAEGIYRTTTIGSEGVTIINVAPGITLSANAKMRTEDGELYTGQVSFTTVPGTNLVDLNLGYTNESKAFISCTVTDGSTVRPVECFGSTFTDDGQFIDYLNSYNTNAPIEIPFIENENINLMISLQGNLIVDTIDTTGVTTPIVKEYQAQTNLGELSCYATLDGTQGEYYPCEALVTSESGANTIVRAGDYSGSPLSAPISYGSDAVSLEIAVSTAFNDGKIYNYLYEEPEYFNFSPYLGDRFTLPTSEPVVLEITDNIESQYLYSFTCRLYGEIVEEGKCILSYQDYQTDERWRTTPHAPSWMVGKAYLPVSEINPNAFSMDVVTENPMWGDYPITDMELDTTNKTIIFDLTFEVPH